VYDSDTWEIDILHAMINVEKWADVGHCAAAGDIITYTIVVSNPSLDTGVSYDLYDYLLGTSWIGYLGPGQSHTYTVTYPVTVITPDPLINAVDVYAYDDQYESSLEPWNHMDYAYTRWEIDILHPAIVLDKYADAVYAHAGDTITYYIDVWNPSSDTTMWAEVYDGMLGGLLFADYIGPGQTAYLGPYYYTVSEGEEWVCNWAFVDAWDYQDHYAYSEDFWCVEVIYPDIDVEKVGPEFASVGETITYTVTVTNTGDTPLYDVWVYDTLLGMYVAHYAVLGVGESQTFSYTFEVPAGEGPLVNTVQADGWDIIWGYAYDEDSWTVTKYSKVSGYKRADLNHDGILTGSELGLENWIVELYGVLDGGGLDIRTTLTDSLGYYEFTMLKPGVYTVSEVMQTGWNAYTADSYMFAVGSGMAFERSFGNLPEGTICGYKWYDYNLNGVWDDGEVGIPGWTIYLEGTDVGGLPWSLVTTTDQDGRYCFVDLVPGVYYINEEMVLGWYPTTSPMITVDRSALEPFAVDNVNFGNAKFGNITGFKWLDEYMNGYKDGNEPFLPGWVIWIEGTLANGTHYGPFSTVTDENGQYAFEGLLPGEYTVWEEIPEGWVNVTPWMRNVTMGEGSWVHCAKFGNVELGSIDGWKFLDWDMDGLFDGIEVGIPDWEITLTGWLNDGDWPWSPVGATPVGPITVLTDEDGYFMFDNLLPGIYQVTEEDRENWYHVTPAMVDLWIASGTHVIDVKFGNVPYTCLWGYKFEDLNGDGIRDEGEPGVPGWHVVITGVQNDGVQVRIELVTDEDGMWATCFNILPGSYVIEEVMQPGWMPTTVDTYEVMLQMAC
ncbi:MAG TPA: SdrD B-like domain-containing protein, partial [Candidatus Paceibacterota bacterium]|nr:SdrD B-like domain-containing protein [Candidatus Paceibacterota bacterium]